MVVVPAVIGVVVEIVSRAVVGVQVLVVVLAVVGAVVEIASRVVVRVQVLVVVGFLLQEK